MKSGSRVRKTPNETAAYAIDHSAVDIPTQCPTLHQMVEKGEFNLLDLPCLQTDVERLLAATTQRMTCISHYLRGLPIPTPILRNVGLLEPDPDNRPQHPCEMTSISADVSARKPTTADEDSSLIVTPNPDNPLSLIFSQKRQQLQQQSSLKTESREVLSDKKHKSKYTSTSPTSGALSAVTSPHDIPNRFWALMEPYCADITESNISYLEGILKSYVEEATTSKYFLLPQAKSEYVSPKRLRRDLTKPEDSNSDSPEAPLNQGHVSGAFKAASEMISLARHVDSQLKEIRPSSSSSVEHLLCSLEKDLYEDNVSSVLRGAVAHMAQEFAVKSPACENEEGSISPSTQNSRGDLTSVCSQPLKNLARQLQVSSSFRVEKKISQASEELGLFPLTLYLNHLSHRPEKPLILLSEKSHGSPTPSEAPNHESAPTDDCKGPILNGLDHSPKESPVSPSSPQSNQPDRPELVDQQKSSTSQSNGCASPRNQTENGEEMSTTPTTTTDPSSGVNEETTSPADTDMGASISDATEEVAMLRPPPLPPATDSNSGLRADPETTFELPASCQLKSDKVLSDCISEKNFSSENHTSSCPGSSASPVKSEEDAVPQKCSPPGGTTCNGNTIRSEGSDWFSNILPHLEDTDDDLSSCLLNLTTTNAVEAVGAGASSNTDQLTLALMRRQRELRLVCAANHNILHRLIQAARRDLQRQEIQRRLAIADADVIEAYNKLESYKVQKRSALKRDRDFAWKTLKERQKIRAELDAFDKKPP
ncbi:Transcriptional adapter 3 [Taenia crassiceps]|uniref:Transcriptional adapter 3 n=1 Tax=Taenia crassiceps TaxID=6207 RepID=A0ABR4QJH1_9CEST